MTYNKEYFIKKFEAIPDTEIGESSLRNKCALYHCGVRSIDFYWVPTEESNALLRLFGANFIGNPKTTDWEKVFNVNDGWRANEILGKTPKERILNKLKSL